MTRALEAFAGVAALYIDPRGPYPALGADCWDASRDARLYAGPWPVVAHPPCGPWGRLRRFCTLQDPTMAPLAVAQVRRWGGVLEHPAASLLWRECGLPIPWSAPPVVAGREWALEVDQCRWGHLAQKPTWLFFVAVRPCDLQPIPCWQAPTMWMRPPRGYDPAAFASKHVPKSQRHLTPPAFAAWLIHAAAHATPAAQAGHRAG